MNIEKRPLSSIRRQSSLVYLSKSSARLLAFSLNLSSLERFGNLQQRLANENASSEWVMYVVPNRDVGKPAEELSKHRHTVPESRFDSAAKGSPAEVQHDVNRYFDGEVDRGDL